MTKATLPCKMGWRQGRGHASCDPRCLHRDSGIRVGCAEILWLAYWDMGPAYLDRGRVVSVFYCCCCFCDPKNALAGASVDMTAVAALLQLPHLCSRNNRHCLNCLLPYKLTRELPVAFRDWEECATPPPWQLNVGIQQKNRVSSKHKQTSVPRAKRWQDCTEILMLTAECECINPHLSRLCEIHSSLPWGDSIENLFHALHSLCCIRSPNSVSGG